LHATKKENMKAMANDPFRTEDTYPAKKRGPQGPIPAKRSIEGDGVAAWA
jgi:hypothetical protein